MEEKSQNGAKKKSVEVVGRNVRREVVRGTRGTWKHTKKKEEKEKETADPLNQTHARTQKNYFGYSRSTT